MNNAARIRALRHELAERRQMAEEFRALGLEGNARAVEATIPAVQALQERLESRA